MRAGVWERPDAERLIVHLGRHDAIADGCAAMAAAERRSCDTDTARRILRRLGFKSPSHYTRPFAGATGGEVAPSIQVAPLSVAPIAAIAQAAQQAPQRQQVEAVPCRVHVDRAPEPAKFHISPWRDPNIERVAFIPDSHHPDSDPIAYPLAIEAIRAFAPDTLVILGDFGDFSSLSSHGKNPARAEHFADEVAYINRELDILQAIPGITRRVKCEGNHLFIAKRFIQDRAPELYGMLDPEKLFKLEERGMEFVPYRTFGKVGRLLFSHEVGYCGTTAAARSRDETNSNVIVGHAHNTTVSYRGDAFGGSHVGVCSGWLGDPKKIKYMHSVHVRRNWAHGFSVAYIERDTGNCHVNFIPIVEGRCVVEGRTIKSLAA